MDSNELNNLLSVLRIGNSAHKNSYHNNSLKLEATTSESDEDQNYCVEVFQEDAIDFSSTPANSKLSGRTLPSYTSMQFPETIDLVNDGTDDEDDEENVIAMPTTARKTINLIDSSSSEDEDDDTAFKPAAPKSLRKAINLIDSSSEDEEESLKQRPAPLPQTASLLLPSLSAALQRPGGSKDILSSLATSNTNQRHHGDDLSNTSEPPPLPPLLPQALLTTNDVCGSTMSHAAFEKKRTQLARDVYAKYNSLVFKNVLPSDLDISWNKRLATTAGVTHYRREVLADPLLLSRYTARIELSKKVSFKSLRTCYTSVGYRPPKGIPLYLYFFKRKFSSKKNSGARYS